MMKEKSSKWAQQKTTYHDFTFVNFRPKIFTQSYIVKFYESIWFSLLNALLKQKMRNLIKNHCKIKNFKEI